MKVASIQTKNFIGARDVDVTLTKQICLFAGKNFSGKSSLAEAVRMALTGESVRVSLKKDYRKLVTEGADVAFAVVEHDGERSAITLPNGAHEHTGKNRPPETLPFCLDAQRFSSLDANARRQFLFSLMNLRTDGPAVTERMIHKGCDATKVELIAPHLRAGFDAAHKEAQGRARDEKTLWRATTGETYGSIKAAKWQAVNPDFDSRLLDASRGKLATIEGQIAADQATLSEMHGRAKAASEQSARIAGIKQKAGSYARIAEKLRVDETELKAWQEKIAQTTSKAGMRMKAEPSYTCPKCSSTLRHDHASGALVEYTPPPPVDVEAINSLAEYQRAHDLMVRSVENDRRDLAAADAAAKVLAELEEGATEAPNQGDMDTIKARIDEAKKAHQKIRQEVREMEDAERATSTAHKRTADAAAHHGHVAQWEAIADALAPHGIPGEMIAEALGPINDRLARSSIESQWLRVGIDADMSISADGGRPYSLLSESERWRVDAQLAEAVSFLSGVRLLVLDRVDVLDLAGREDLLYWLDGLAADGEIDSALLFGTLKALPTVSGNIEAVWLENGTSGQVREAA